MVKITAKVELNSMGGSPTTIDVIPSNMNLNKIRHFFALGKTGMYATIETTIKRIINGIHSFLTDPNLDLETVGWPKNRQDELLKALKGKINSTTNPYVEIHNNYGQLSDVAIINKSVKRTSDSVYLGKGKGRVREAYLIDDQFSAVIYDKSTSNPKLFGGFREKYHDVDVVKEVLEGFYFAIRNKSWGKTINAVMGYNQARDLLFSALLDSVQKVSSYPVDQIRVKLVKAFT